MDSGDTKTQILDSAQALIERVGINAMSYQDISKAVNIRKASIHYHFPTKDDLVAALLDRYNADFLRQLEAILSSGAVPTVKLRRYCSLFITKLRCGDQTQACLCSMLGAELETLKSPLAQRVSSFYSANEKRLAQILAEGRESGEFAFLGEVEAMSQLMFSLLEGGMLIARAQGGVPYYEAIIRQMLQMVGVRD
ncbi:TetR/AcrR family transcriptional regulator [Almyronema epifaneia]|uniref:TetR/AcrR family transcriptional regulator n=1 Tax=Almyronema epifaneia S1 TaxID=2991925 RepID=A0ABW6IIM6_9CYAN